MESKQMKYGDCHPKGKPGVRFPLADVDVDPYNIGARRAHMVAFLRHMELYDEESWAQATASAIAAISSCLHNAGWEKVGIPYFEFVVDRGVWIFYWRMTWHKVSLLFTPTG
ncbi:hypothetical protein N0V84_012780 [Fusarium piperis]|uniref:Uncharacterized protein n=1 Tax=Fusarium piperis TaxID=1435070 RepID=A0A9W8W3H7_9HYPO|nr:hypothetical protein N0V84_012780 [Fusarium piperis]